jgi:DNA-binding transcriptional MerR regulator
MSEAHERAAEAEPLEHQSEHLYTVAEVARLFELPESRVRYWSQTDFISPSVRRGSRRFYTFQDLISIKVAK